MVANGVFDYLPEPPRALARMGGMMRRMLVASFPDRAAFRAMPRRLYWRARGLTISQFHEGDIAALAQSAGFARFTIERIGPIFLLIVDRRGR